MASTQLEPSSSWVRRVAVHAVAMSHFRCGRTTIFTAQLALRYLNVEGKRRCTAAQTGANLDGVLQAVAVVQVGAASVFSVIDIGTV